ncbi:caspase family protein [Bradyrhizobium sp. CCBAU 051011]|uniref:caspase family protein n=1 Tax=Bradyrhizobium sp. CCBAU 051011 TaxID=858422 RepID=UPI00137B69A4
MAHRAGKVRHFIQSMVIASRTLAGATACMALVLLAATPAMAEKRVALAIGNDLYPNLPADRQLRKAVNDATTVAGTLRSLGFEVIVGTNLGRQAMIDKLAEFTAAAGRYGSPVLRRAWRRDLRRQLSGPE